MFLLVGLGNPGKQYERTRHNLGRILVERWAVEQGGGFEFHKKFKCQLSHVSCHMSHVIALLPETFMNNSGDAVQTATHFYKIPSQNIWIVMDDLNLDFGVIRTRQSGSDGGHNGLKSMLEKMGTDQIPRIRIGIGNNSVIPAEDYVLQPFSDDEQSAITSDIYPKFSSLLTTALISHFPTDTLT